MGRAEDIFQDIKTRGIIAIDDFIANSSSEEFFLDFKRSADNGIGPNFSIDLQNLAKAISGFGNSEGGIIIWGIDCSKGKKGFDTAHTKHPIEEPIKFKTKLDGAISGRTIPVHSTVENFALADSESNNKGYVVTLIPKSNYAPHQAIPELKYYMRAGSDFSPVPHGVLQGMFGRRPQPILSQRFDIFKEHRAYLVERGLEKKRRIDFEVVPQIFNDGSTLAENIFTHVEILNNAGADSVVSFDRRNDEMWNYIQQYKTKISATSKPSIYLPPQTTISPVGLNFSIIQPFSGDITIKIMCGCSGGQPHYIEITLNKENLEQIYSSPTGEKIDIKNLLMQRAI